MPKRTIENCSLIKKAIKELAGEPKVLEGKCEGYHNEHDEPHEVCQKCKLSIYDT